MFQPDFRECTEDRFQCPGIPLIAALAGRAAFIISVIRFTTRKHHQKFSSLLRTCSGKDRYSEIDADCCKCSADGVGMNIPLGIQVASLDDKNRFYATCCHMADLPQEIAFY